MTTAKDDTAATTERSVPARRGLWWKLIGGAVALAGLAWGTYQVVGLLAHEERTETTRFGAAGLSAVDIDNSAGSIIVVGESESDEVVVTAHISEGLRRTGNRQEVVGDRLELEGSCPTIGSDWCGVRYIVEIPAGLAVVANADDGRVEVTGIDARVEIDNDNGSITLEGLAGDVVADNDNGSITATEMRSDEVSATTNNGRVTVEFAEAPTTVTARSDNGRVEVVVPDSGDAYRVDIDTRNGDIESSTMRIDPASPRVLTVESDNGDVTARMRP